MSAGNSGAGVSLTLRAVFKSDPVKNKTERTPVCRVTEASLAALHFWLNVLDLRGVGRLEPGLRGPWVHGGTILAACGTPWTLFSTTGATLATCRHHMGRA
jgi:hypothetical protein